MRFSTTVLALLVLVPRSAVQAQRPAGDLRGRVIRIHRPEAIHRPGGILYAPAPRVGTLLAAMGDTLVIRTEGKGEIERVVLGKASLVQLRTRVRGRTLGGFIGGAAGVAIGTAVGLVTFEQEYGPVCRSIGEGIALAFVGRSCPRGKTNSLGAYTAGRALLGGMAGAVLGSLIGDRYERDGWIPLSRGPLRVGVAAAPAHGGWGPAVRVRF